MESPTMSGSGLVHRICSSSRRRSQAFRRYCDSDDAATIGMTEAAGLLHRPVHRRPVIRPRHPRTSGSARAVDGGELSAAVHSFESVVTASAPRLGWCRKVLFGLSTPPSWGSRRRRRPVVGCDRRLRVLRSTGYLTRSTLTGSPGNSSTIRRGPTRWKPASTSAWRRWRS